MNAATGYGYPALTLDFWKCLDMFGQTWIDSTWIWIAAPLKVPDGAPYFLPRGRWPGFDGSAERPQRRWPCHSMRSSFHGTHGQETRTVPQPRSDQVDCAMCLPFFCYRVVSLPIFLGCTDEFHACSLRTREPDIAESSGKVQGNAYGLILVSRLQIQHDLDCATGSVLWWVSLRKMLGLVSVGRSCSSQGVGMWAISLPEWYTLDTWRDMNWHVGCLQVIQDWPRSSPRLQNLQGVADSCGQTSLRTMKTLSPKHSHFSPVNTMPPAILASSCILSTDVSCFFLQNQTC